jgi:hypothetical protein
LARSVNQNPCALAPIESAVPATSAAPAAILAKVFT